MVNLTNKYVASVKPPRDKKYIRLWDDSISGFGLRVTDNGVKSFIFEGRQFLSKKTKQVKIGRAGEISVSEARASAVELSRLFRSGEFEKLAERRQGDNSTTCATERYLKVGLFGRSPAYIGNVKYHLLVEFCGRHGTRNIQDVNRHQTMGFVQEAKIKISPDASLKRYRSLTAFFNYLVNEGTLEVSPLAGTKPPASPTSRDRVLSIDELKSIWNAADALTPTWQAFIRFLMLTGQRRNEVAGLHVNEIDGDWWTLPANRSKNSLPNKVFLSPTAKRLLPEPNKTSGLFFTHNKKTPVSGFSRTLSTLRGAAGFSNWTLHDFRRSFSTHLHEMGHPPHIIEACINHVSGAKSGVAGVYNKAEYLEQRERAFGDWSSALLDD
ncbi:tyrosine-type recombinase/integrase [Alphaproteobacteria bacterium]|nr:tyrosine-type recombinase/integrase [Alphaproteobacteria bacterium]